MINLRPFFNLLICGWHISGQMRFFSGKSRKLNYFQARLFPIPAKAIPIKFQRLGNSSELWRKLNYFDNNPKDKFRAYDPGLRRFAYVTPAAAKFEEKLLFTGIKILLASSNCLKIVGIHGIWVTLIRNWPEF